jgi:hypothetical protein
MSMENAIKLSIGRQYVEANFASENSDFVAKCYREYVRINQELFAKIPFPVVFTNVDTYKTAKEMRERVLNEQVIYIYTEYGGHPFLNQEENNIARAVHDVWAHLVCGCPFTFQGEFNAYLEQRKHYPKWTWNVLFTEIPAQTAAYYYKGDFSYVQRAFIAPVEWVEVCEMNLIKDYSQNAIMDESGRVLAAV